MSANYKKSFRLYSAWNYQKETEDLDKASEEGWQLVRGGCFSSEFVKNPDVRYRYQLDYGRIEDMGRYIETFREQGWEYINSTFNGWHYFRKLYDPSLPEEAYEIFTDTQSLLEMNNRWAKLALIVGLIFALNAIIFAIRLITHPTLPLLIQFLTSAIEGIVLLRGCFIMRNPASSRSRRGDSVLLAVFFTVIILGAVANIVLTEQRPFSQTSQQASSVDHPVVDNRWADFKVTYADNYYLDLKFEADAPFTFAVLNDAGEPVYQVTDTHFEEKNIQLKLPKGHYCYSISCATGFHVECGLE